MTRIDIKLKTALSLGIFNIARVILYRLGIQLRYPPLLNINSQVSTPPFFRMPLLQSNTIVRKQWVTDYLYFGWFTKSIAEIMPNWHQDPLTGKLSKTDTQPWWRLNEFDPSLDVKNIWELSRFEWVLACSQQALAGNSQQWAKLNAWLADWCAHNPPYYGLNWKCGQEASIRIIHLAMAALILDQIKSPETGLITLIKTHLKRISPTISYAIAQDNNHAISEAAALFVGGTWLSMTGDTDGKKWEVQGRKWLENRVARLIETDGSFSQYSVNYHRMILDTLSFVEIWRRHHTLTQFSDTFYSRTKSATQWLATLVNPITGDAPNIGANDGARLLSLEDTDYRDYRPSVERASDLFLSQKINSMPISSLFDKGGYAVLHLDNAMAILRYPRFRFRPSQTDCLHIDLWRNGENLLRDGGTYSYNTDAQWINYFPNTIAHNTIQFDNQNQMPRLSRFLWGNWLTTKNIIPIQTTKEGIMTGASYKDSQGATHFRKMVLQKTGLTIIDDISGFTKTAILRWRLKPGNWQLNGHHLSDGCHTIALTATMPILRVQVTQGWESRYYQHKNEVPVLEIEVSEPGTLTTEYLFNS